MSNFEFLEKLDKLFENVHQLISEIEHSKEVIGYKGYPAFQCPICFKNSPSHYDDCLIIKIQNRMSELEKLG